MRSAWRRHDLSDTCAALAMALAVAWVVALLVLHTLQPEIDPVRAAVAAYEVGEHGYLVTVAGLCQSAAALGLAVALVAAPRGHVVWPSAALLVAAAAALVVGMTTAPGAPTTSASASSSVDLWPTVALAAVALAGVGLMLPTGRSAGRRPRRIALLVAAVVVVGAGVLVLAAPAEIAGAAERAWLGAVAIWVLAVGTHLRAAAVVSVASEPDGRLVAA